MILYGRYLSPYTRRVAITLRLYDMPFEHQRLLPWRDLKGVMAVNPLGRVPALRLDDGSVMVESGVILDYLDHEVGPGRALVPLLDRGVRRAALDVVALAEGTMDKAIELETERHLRPKGKESREIHDRFQSQTVAGLAALEGMLTSDWYVGGRLTQADVTTGVLTDFLAHMLPDLVPQGRYPRLERHRARCRQLPAFLETALESAEPALPLP